MGAATDAVSQCVEELCERGCTRVREVIADLEAGTAVAELAGLNSDLHPQVLHELKSIMAVYDQP